MRPIVLVCGALLALAPTACSSSPHASSQPVSSTVASAATSDPLVGSWDTGPIPKRKLRAALNAAGYTDAQVTGFFEQFGITNAYEFKIVFYRENGVPFSYKKGWDPSAGDEPNDADHGPYTLLRNHRFETRGVDPPTDQFREVYSYRVTRSRLTLGFISLTEPGISEADQATDTMMSRLRAARPYKRIE
jgi:hypothetical protein